MIGHDTSTSMDQVSSTNFDFIEYNTIEYELIDIQKNSNEMKYCCQQFFNLTEFISTSPRHLVYKSSVAYQYQFQRRCMACVYPIW